MTVKLLPLGEGASLEFDLEDREAVRAAIVELFGDARQSEYVTSATVWFGGESFAYQAEWDDPCLITDTPRGRRMLEALAEHLAARRNPSSDPLRGPPSPARGEG